MRISDLITEAAIPAISPQAAHDADLFGPLYHGTRADISAILASGFDVERSIPAMATGYNNRPLGTANGYRLTGYAGGIAAPVHHLGFGTYFTTVKAIAKNFAGGTVRGMRTFYADVPRLEEINFGSPNTMMRWWQSHGYTMTAAATQAGDARAWIAATHALTANLRQDFDAVWFKGKGIRKLLDGDQVCVFDPARIRVLDPSLARGLEIGAKVTHTQVIASRYAGSNETYVDQLRAGDFGAAGRLSGWRGVFRSVDHDGNDIPRSGTAMHGNYPIHFIPPAGMIGTIVNKHRVPEPYREKWGDWSYSVKWQKGGEQHNYNASELRPVTAAAQDE